MVTIELPDDNNLIYPENIDSCVNVLRTIEAYFGRSVYHLCVSIIETDHIINNLNSLRSKK